MYSELFSKLLEILGKVLNWASPFFLGKMLEKQKWEGKSNEEKKVATESRVETHRDVVVSSDAASSRDELRKWSRSDD